MSDQPENSRNTTELDDELRREMARRTRRSFLIGGVATAATIGAYEWLSHAKQINQLESPLRRAERFNAAVSRAMFRETALAPIYPVARSTNLRLNGDLGLDPHMILDSWRLQVVGLERPQQYKQFIEDVDLWTYRSSDDPDDANYAEPAPEQPSPKTRPGSGPKAGVKAGAKAGLEAGAKAPPDKRPHVDQTIDLTIPKAPASDTERTPGIVLSLNDLRALPFAGQVTQFKCIEGWSQITSFAGARFADFLKAYPPQMNSDGTLPRYAGMETSDGTFSSSVDMATLLHPQTLLCWQMNGKPLTPGHGAPLRLAMPLKYGYKQIKQIAKITYTNRRPVDFWETQGYDWYGGI